MSIKTGTLIGVQLLKLVFGCYFIVTVIVTTVQIYLEYLNVENNIIIELDNIGRSFEKSLSVSIWAYDLEAIQSTLDGIQKIEIVSGTKVKSKTDDLEKFSGFYSTDKNASHLKPTRSFGGFQIQEMLVIENNTNNTPIEHHLYEYKLDIHYITKSDKPVKNHVGSLYIYANKNAVLNRFKSSFFLIITNAFLKTISLWVIFLFFSKKLLSAPLLKLSKATTAFSSDKECESELISQLHQYSTIQPETELKQLTVSFLIMRQKITQKIIHLNELNYLAIAFTQAENEIDIFDKISYMLFDLLGPKNIVVLNEKRQLILSSSDMSEQLYHSVLTKENDFNLDILRGQGQISYIENHIYPDTVEKNDFTPFLYIPIFYNNKVRNEIWVIGKINKEHLDQDGKVYGECLSLLQVITRMISASLSNIIQNTIIEEQNRTLENRVTERTVALEEANKALKYIALHDTLTQLPNRSLFNDRLVQAVELSRRNKMHFSLLNIDVTDFKKINDTYGHDAGDLVLIEIGNRLLQAVRKCDTVARMGGDEFAAILLDQPMHDSCPLAVQRVLHSMENLIAVDKNNKILVKLNIGISVFPHQTTDINQLLKYADIAMYKAKRSGLGYAIYSE